MSENNIKKQENRMNSPLFIFHAAVDFFEKGVRAASENFKLKEGGEIKFDTMIHPKLCMPIVNIVFSFELMIKGLLKQSKNATVKKHDLVILFKALDIGIKERIIEHYKTHDHYKKLIGIHLSCGDGTSHSKRMEIPAPEKNEKGILSMLEANKNYFASFRYLFEFDENEEYIFLFSEFSNLAFSTLVIFGETLNLQVVSVKKKKGMVE